MKISEVAKLLNIPASKIRYYEQRGILLSNRTGNGYREYNKNSIEMIKLLLFAKELGFSLNEIKTFASAMRNNNLEKEKVNQGIQNKINEFDFKIKQLQQFQKNLKKVLNTQCEFSHIYKKKG